MLVCALLPTSLSYSASLIYLSAGGVGKNTAPVAPQETLKYLPGGGSFHIWAQPEVLITGISLELGVTGTAIKFADSTVHNPAVGSESRWLPSLIRDGTVTDTSITRIEAGALAPLAGFGTGIGPLTSGMDPFYDMTDGFLFATIDFEVLSPTLTSTVSLSVGHNLLSDTMGLLSDPLFLGVGDGPVSIMSGASGAVVDLHFVPRPLHASDFDSDGDVDGQDFLSWQSGLGTLSGAMRSDGDANSDTRVDALDLSVWAMQFGTPPPPSAVAIAAVPELNSFALVAWGTLLGLGSQGRWSKLLGDFCS